MAMSIAVLKSVKNVLAYHQEGLENQRDDYWLRPEGAPEASRWRGKLAGELVDVSGPIKPEDLKRVLDREGLGIRNAGSKKATVAIDAVLAAPKVFDLLSLDPEMRPRLEALFDRAFDEYFGRLEAACYTRTGRRGETVVPGQGLVAATFLHRTARPVRGEPPAINTHRHLVISNLTVGPDGQYRTLDLTRLFRAAPVAYTAAMKVLSDGIRDLGHEVHRDRGAFRVEGVPDAVIRELSPRSRLIRQAAGEGASHAARNVAAHTTREKKRDVPLTDVIADSLRRVARAGFSLEQLRSLREDGPAKKAEKEPTLDELLDRTEAALDATVNHFPERKYVQEAILQSVGTAHRVEEVEAAARRRLAEGARVVRLGEYRKEVQYATASTLRQERELLSTLEGLARRNDRPVSGEAIRRVLAGRSLSDEQARCVRTTLGAGGLSVIQGLPGTGKSTVCEALSEGLFEAGYQKIYGVAVSGIAADNLAKKAPKVTPLTVAKLCGSQDLGFQGDLQKGVTDSLLHDARMVHRAGAGKTTWDDPTVRLDPNTAIILDETSQISTADLLTLSRAVEKARARLILLGDSRQLSSAGVGGPFAHLVRSPWVTVTTLSEIRRQRHAPDREAVRDAWHGGERMDRAIDHLQQTGQLTVVPGTREEAMRRLVADWAAAGGAREPAKNLIFTGLREEADALTRLAQEERLRAGELGPVVFTNDRFTFLAGDLIRFETNKRMIGIFNGTVATVEGASGGTLTVRLEDGRRRKIDLEREYSPQDVRLAYAGTTHAGQGLSVPHSWVLAGGALANAEATLVQVSRGVEQTHLYLDRFEAGENLEVFRKRAKKQEAQHLAHTVLEGTTPAAPDSSAGPAPEEKPRAAPARRPALKTHRHRR